MARNQTTDYTRGVPDNSWYRDSRGKYWVLINTANKKAWRQNGAQPGPPYVELKNVPPDAPFSPNATRSTNAFQESLGSINAGDCKKEKLGMKNHLLLDIHPMVSKIKILIMFFFSLVNTIHHLA